MQKFVAYYRVSTDKQGRSGLGLDAQTATVQGYVQQKGGELIAFFQEVESGKRKDRPELLKALALCRQKKAVLVIAKLDRLARNTAFIANLIESGAEFVACDMPHANKLTLHIIAAMAEYESEAISQRTKEAMAIAKQRGVKIGNPCPDIPAINRAWSNSARQFRADHYPTIQQMRAQGMTLEQIAQKLNERGIKTCQNRSWYASTVCRLIKDAA
jgi:DNA invertase Pin-like site-specific DNA recombinase